MVHVFPPPVRGDGDGRPFGHGEAAGAGSRMGMPKALVHDERGSWLRRGVEVLREGGCDPVVVVLGAAPQAADALKFSPEYLQKFGVVDRVISEPMGGAHRDFDLAAKALKDAIVDSLGKLQKKSTKKLLEDRYTKFRNLGEFAETATTAKT